MITTSSGIYMLRNGISGLPYIGQATNLRRRINSYKNPKEDNYICNSIRKHGWDNFEVIILHEDVPITDLDWLEKQCIWIFGSMVPNGYNLESGGANGLASKETKERQREVKLGKKNPFYGKNHTTETKRKQSEANIGEKNCKVSGKVDGDILRNWREGKNLTRSQLSKIINISKDTIGQWERNKCYFSLESRQKWIQEFGFDPVEEFQKSNKDKYPKNKDYSYTHPEESKRKISIANKGKLAGEGNPKFAPKVNGLNLRFWRKKNNFTQKQLAKLLGCTNASVCDWEIEKHGISQNYRDNWIHKFGFDPIEKFGEAEE